MKRGFLILLTALLVGTVGFFVTRQQCCCSISDSTSTAHDGGSMLPELEWLHHELKLTDEQKKLLEASAAHYVHNGQRYARDLQVQE